MTDVVVSPEPSRKALDAGYDTAVAFAELLVKHGEERGLIGPREVLRVWTRHIVNSAAIAPFVGDAKSIVDVGSGAGLPGVVLAGMFPEVQVHLVEPMERRVAWLTFAFQELGLENVTVHHGQAQEFHKQLSADIVTARAVAALDKLLSWTWPLVARGGALLAMKGARAQEELDAASGVLGRLATTAAVVHEVDVLDDGDITRVVEIRRA